MLKKIIEHPTLKGIISNEKRISHVDLLGEGVKINGSYSSAKNVRVVGSIEGDLHVDGNLTVDEEGIVNGNIFARDIYVSGTVQGDIKSKGKVFVRGTAVISGGIHTKSLEIEAKAVVEGDIHMSGEVDDVMPKRKERKRQAS
ncbi:MAG: polymer-forming cytoskeletal protein [Balneolaceae bacterium]